jgi:hypothetical protein
VTKLDANGHFVYWSQTMQAHGNELGLGVGVDLSGDAYLYGAWDLNSAIDQGFPQYTPLTAVGTGAFDSFVLEYDPTGTQVLFGSTIIGGTGDSNPPPSNIAYSGAPAFIGGNGAGGIVIGPTNDIYLTGTTTVPTNATITVGSGDMYVVRIAAVTPPTLGNDRFENNDTSDAATGIGTVTAANPIALGNLNTFFHPDGSPDYDFYQVTVGQSGTLRVDLTDISVFASGPNGTFGVGGDLNLRVFRLDDNGVLTDLSPPAGFGSPGFLQNSDYQTVTAAVNAGDIIYIDVNPFNFSQATYGLRVRVS